MPTTKFEAYRRTVSRRVDAEIARLLPPATLAPRPLHQAMRYAALGPGKRIRPLFAVLSFDTLSGRSGGIWAAAAALEMAHAFSLAHDDLPCMDDDDLRRGRPTLHKNFGEAIALLAGDALLAAAFGAVAGAGSPREIKAREASLSELAAAVGPAGMVGGQVLDMLAEGRPATRAGVRRIHSLKTGALIRASARIGGYFAGAGAAKIRQVSGIAETLGLAFQLRDDYLNATSTDAALGKAGGSDARRRKATYPRAVGLRKTEAEIRRLGRKARELAGRLPRHGDFWEALVDYLEERPH